MLFAIAEVAAIVVSSYVRGLARNAWCDNWGRGKYCLKCVKLTTWSALYKGESEFVCDMDIVFFLFLHFFSTTRRLKYVEKFLRHLFKCSQCPSSLLLGILEKVGHWLCYFILLLWLSSGDVICNATTICISLTCPLRAPPTLSPHYTWRSNTHLSINDYTPGHL